MKVKMISPAKTAVDSPFWRTGRPSKAAIKSPGKKETSTVAASAQPTDQG